MTPEASLEAFKVFAASRGTDLRNGALSNVMDTVLQFYTDCRATDLVSEDGDMLLFQYGCYDFGEGEWFEFDITRQFISALAEDDDALSQLHVTFRFAPDDELRMLKPFNQWCHSIQELKGFREAIFSGPAFALVHSRQPAGIDVLWEQV